MNDIKQNLVLWKSWIGKVMSHIKINILMNLTVELHLYNFFIADKASFQNAQKSDQGNILFTFLIVCHKLHYLKHFQHLIQLSHMSVNSWSTCFNSKK